MLQIWSPSDIRGNETLETHPVEVGVDQRTHLEPVDDGVVWYDGVQWWGRGAGWCRMVWVGSSDECPCLLLGLASGVWRLAFGVWGFGVWRLAFGGWG